MSRDETHLPILVKTLDEIESAWRINESSDVEQALSVCTPPEPGPGRTKALSNKQRLRQTRKLMRPLQRTLYAGKQYSILLVFQALDAAGKDGGIREVLKGLDPAGIRVASFKRPTKRELAHDFLWRTNLELPERGNITAFNRSYYEEVLAVKVHPGFLTAQYAGHSPDPELLWPERYRAIREHERHLAHSNTVVLKFWLNVSRQQQAKRFLERLETPSKHWKFSAGDITESTLREQYDDAVATMFRETSRPWAPWFCIPADDRWYLREQIASVLFQTLDLLELSFPESELPQGEEKQQLYQQLQDTVDQRN